MNVVLIDAIKNDELYVADENDKIIGFVHFHKRRDGWNTVHEIGVNPEYQGIGIGKHLFNLVPKPRRLKTTVDNKKSNDFYKYQGLINTGTEKGRKREVNVWNDIKESVNEYDLIGTTATLIKNEIILFDRDGEYHGRSGMKLGYTNVIKDVKNIGGKILIGFGANPHYDIKDFKIIKTERIYREDDPYGEENWAVESVQSKQDFKIGDKVIINENLLNYNWKHLNHLIGKQFVIYKISENKFFGSVAYLSSTNDMQDISTYYIPFDCLDHCDNIKMKKITNPDIDPYDEEDWGYEPSDIYSND